MDFYEVLDDVLELLRSRGRVTYRALKVQFQIDDEQLEALKEEIIYAQQVARDEDDRVLVWTGETGEIQITPSQPAKPESQPVIEQVQPVQATSQAVEPHPPDAERRQLTVMFCDVVGSTSLSGALDPEDLREVIRAYQTACTEVIQRYEGHVAQLLGDGLLVYFGYPVAHEDDAQRAVRSGLGILEAIGVLNTRLEQSKGVKLAVRLGIHTGLVVVGEMGGEGRQEQLALGETPNVAARIQGIAEPNAVVISDATHRLIQGFFDCDSLGEHDLRGVSQPIAVRRVLRESGLQSRLDVVATRGLTPLVGRESESTLLFERWEQAKDGSGQVILLSGEAGIGKSRLVQVLKDHVSEDNHARLECRSSPYFTNSALYPVIDMLQRVLQWQPHTTPEEKLGRLEHELSQYRLPLEESVPLFGTLLSLPVPEDQYPTLNLTPQRQRQKTLEAIVSILLELAEHQPVLFILEDLHWTDPTTLELLELLIDQTPAASIYVLLTCRPEYQPSWSHRSYLTEITVNRLSRDQIERMAQQVAGGKGLPTEIVQQLAEKTDGVPLYVEEMTKAVLESGVLKEMDERYELTGSMGSLTIPATLQDSLMARLDRLVTAKAVAQYASVIGRRFSYELLQAVSELDETMLQHELGRLVESELVYQRGLPPQATYTFKHALIRDTAYESLLRSTRQGYHRRIAGVLAERFSEMAEAQPELLAHHYTEAGMNEQAVGYWQQAGENAVQRSANVEAIAHLTKALALLTTLPDTSERALKELTLQRNLGVSLLATKGFAAPEVEQAYGRARALCGHVPDSHQVCPVLFGLWGFYQVKGELQTAREVAEQLLTFAQRQNDSAFLLQGYRALGDTLKWLGDFVAARVHLEQGIELYDPQQHANHIFLYGQDPGMGCRVHVAWVLWVLGYPDQALVRSREAIALSEELLHPFSLAFALSMTAFLYQLRREWQAAMELAERTMTLATEQRFSHWLASGMTNRGFALVGRGQIEEGLTQILQAMATRQAENSRPSWQTRLAEIYGTMDQAEEGLRILDEAMSAADKMGVRLYEAERHRIKGELLLQQSSNNATEAESCFQQAITIAQNQSAKSWELRAATSLARLWQSQGKRDEVRELLEPVYSWFTEGFDTADLIDAKALLDELEG